MQVIFFQDFKNLKSCSFNFTRTYTHINFIYSLLLFVYITLFVFVLVKFSSRLCKSMFSIFTLNNSTNMLFTNLNIVTKFLFSILRLKKSIIFLSLSPCIPQSPFSLIIYLTPDFLYMSQQLEFKSSSSSNGTSYCFVSSLTLFSVYDIPLINLYNFTL